VIARGPDAGRNTKALLERLGGLGHFVGSKDHVLIKPNIAWDRTPAQAANTDPAVVAAVIRACREAGVKQITVMDCSVNDPARCYERSGIAAAAREAQANVVLPDEVEKEAVEIPGLMGQWQVPAPFLTATKIINVPVAKHHGSARITAGMKNWFGITRDGRGLLHASLAESIVAIAAAVRPTLTIIDATRVLMRNGPQGGNLDDVKALNTVAAAFDVVALDAWAASILEAKQSKVSYLGLAEEKGLGKANYKALEPVELKVT
jgi:uncharacterized protein (DUF362 family)